MMLVCGILALVFVFIACELGQRFTNAFVDVDNVLSQIRWYLLPNEMQRILPMVLIYAQEPIVVQFFGSMSCSRTQFKSVSNFQSIAEFLFENIYAICSFLSDLGNECCVSILHDTP